MDFLPHKNILDLIRMKALASGKINMTQKLRFVFWNGRKHCREKRKAGYQHFLPFPSMLNEVIFLRVTRIGHCVVKGKEMKYPLNRPA